MFQKTNVEILPCFFRDFYNGFYCSHSKVVERTAEERERMAEELAALKNKYPYTFTESILDIVKNEFDRLDGIIGFKPNSMSTLNSTPSKMSKFIQQVYPVTKKYFASESFSDKEWSNVLSELGTLVKDNKFRFAEEFCIRIVAELEAREKFREGAVA